MDTLIKAVVVLAWVSIWFYIGTLMTVPSFLEKTKPREYPVYCFNDADNFKSDVCSKIGKQWSL